MSKSSAPSTPQSVQINLRDMGLKYLGAIQRSFDMAACTIGSLRCQTEKDYDEFARIVRFMPSQQHHLGFDRIRPEAENWLLRQLLADSMGMLIPMLEDARSVSELAKWKAAGGTDQSAVKKILDEDRKAFLRLSLEDKLKHLKEKFAISASNEAFLPGYLKLGAALTRGGTVAENDVTDNKNLVVRLAVVELGKVEKNDKSTPGSGITGRLLEAQKRFAVGDKIEFNKDEVLSLFAMIALFVTGIMGSLQTFVKKTIPDEATSAN
jgi:hypothetical protein